MVSMQSARFSKYRPAQASDLVGFLADAGDRVGNVYFAKIFIDGLAVDGLSAYAAGLTHTSRGSHRVRERAEVRLSTMSRR